MRSYSALSSTLNLKHLLGDTKSLNKRFMRMGRSWFFSFESIVTYCAEQNVVKGQSLLLPTAPLSL